MALRHNDIARNFRTEIGEETAFGTKPSGSWPEAMDVLQLVHDDLHIDGFEQELLDVADAHVRRTGTVDAVVGQKRATTWRGSVYLKAIPTASQLTASGSSAQLSHRILFRHMFGTETVAAGPAENTLSFRCRKRLIPGIRSPPRSRTAAWSCARRGATCRPRRP